MTDHIRSSRDKTHKKVQVVVLVTVSSSGKKLLLLLKTNRKRNSFWQNITGSVEKGEAFAEAARRELQEESGLQAQDAGELLDLHYTNQFLDGRGREVEERSFLYLLPVGRPEDVPAITIDPHEHEDFKWVALEEVGPASYHFPSNYEVLCQARTHVQG